MVTDFFQWRWNNLNVNFERRTIYFFLQYKLTQIKFSEGNLYFYSVSFFLSFYFSKVNGIVKKF